MKQHEELKNLAEKTATLAKQEVNRLNSSKSKNPSPDQEKTRDIPEPTKVKEYITKSYEEAEIEEKNISEQMDEIIKINDKFTLVESILYLLCKELEIPDRSQPGAIGAAIKTLYEAHYKSMENWKNITKSVQKDDIRQ